MTIDDNNSPLESLTRESFDRAVVRHQDLERKRLEDAEMVRKTVVEMRSVLKGQRGLSADDQMRLLTKQFLVPFYKVNEILYQDLYKEAFNLVYM